MVLYQQAVCLGCLEANHERPAEKCEKFRQNFSTFSNSFHVLVLGEPQKGPHLRKRIMLIVD